MTCPKCGSGNIQAVTVQTKTGGVTTTTEEETKGFGCIKAIIGWILFSVPGILCGLCGMGKGKSKTVTVDNTTIKNEIHYCCLDCGNQFRK